MQKYKVICQRLHEHSETFLHLENHSVFSVMVYSLIVLFRMTEAATYVHVLDREDLEHKINIFSLLVPIKKEYDLVSLTKECN